MPAPPNRLLVVTEAPLFFFWTTMVLNGPRKARLKLDQKESPVIGRYYSGPTKASHYNFAALVADTRCQQQVVCMRNVRYFFFSHGLP
jgi:hypothetical protein